MAIRLGILSTYPPTHCGVATFCESLATRLVADGAEVGVVRLVDRGQDLVGQAPAAWAPVVQEWATTRLSDAEQVARTLDTYDVAVLQHEYAVFGGDDGEDVLEVVARLHVPLVTVLHTVLATPTPNQRRVLDWLLEFSAAVVTTTRTARDRLVEGWSVDPGRITIIPRGALGAATGSGPDVPHQSLPPRPTVLTWGLLAPGKGVEWALLALAALGERIDLPAYDVVGPTHPRVLATDGEAYRDGLAALVHDLELEDVVSLDARAVPGPELDARVRAADIVLLPYDADDRVGSSVLVEAVAAGNPVIATSFPQAVELLSGGAGVLVPQRDPAALAAALEHVLTGRRVAARMATAARRLAPTLAGPQVARQYLDLASSVRRPAEVTVA